MARNYQDLIIWQKAMDLVQVIYGLSRRFPLEETYGLTAQLRRAAVSIPSNIAEGQGRDSRRDFARFLTIAHGSSREVETQLLIAVRLHYLTPTDVSAAQALCEETGRLLQGLLRKLRCDT